MVMDITVLKEIILDAVEKQLDHKNLDQDVEFFKEHPSTTEMVAVFVWQEIGRRLKDRERHVKLFEVKILEYLGLVGLAFPRPPE